MHLLTETIPLLEKKDRTRHLDKTGGQDKIIQDKCRSLTKDKNTKVVFFFVCFLCTVRLITVNVLEKIKINSL